MAIPSPLRRSAVLISHSKIFLFIIPVTLIFHDFWTVEGQEMQNQLNHFMKNLAIMGGMLYVIVMGSGPYSGSGAVPAGP